ncbi:MAG: dihydrolipoyl dehydrogenase [Verrucomicrobia bacterium]|nr:dihydrolipoyl dehydrogenase [Verrucomicrobiota bacterium]MBU6446527.1 dihydrolipoyl dehydrogenase [Verrucomicrobiota bacterium]
MFSKILRGFCLTYDVVVIGSGPGGYVAAIRAAQLGLKTACIEKNKTLGGTCLNVGCIPSKVLLHDSERSSNFAKIMQRKTDVVSSFTGGIEFLFKKNKIDWIRGSATLKTPHTISVEGQTVDAKQIILATGSEAVSLPFLPFDEKKILSSTGALALSSVPKKMLVVGAGIIGVELGSVYKRLGSEVVFIEFLDRICPAFDSALSKALLKSLTHQGMTFHLSHKVMKAEGTTLTVQGPSGETKFAADVVLVAVGRRPFSTGLGLEAVGIQKDPKGFVQIDGSFRTSQPNIYAIGDLVDGPMLAHKAEEEGIAVAEIIAGHHPTIHYIAIPNVAYTHPEVAAVGLTEEEVKAKQIPYKVSQFPFKANSRARCIDDEEGFVKMLAHTPTGRILGVHMIGPNVSELIAEAVLAIQLKATANQLADTCFAHPTLSEAVKEAALGLFKAPIHL